MANRPPLNPTDIEDTVDQITSQFYQKKETKNDQLDRYLNFSVHHNKSNHIMIGVALFFVLIFGVWGFLWYQSVRSVDFTFTDSLNTNIIANGTDDITTLFNELSEFEMNQNAQRQEATLKSDLSAALSQQIKSNAVLGTTTTNTASTTIE